MSSYAQFNEGIVDECQYLLSKLSQEVLNAFEDTVTELKEQYAPEHDGHYPSFMKFPDNCVPANIPDFDIVCGVWIFRKPVEDSPNMVFLGRFQSQSEIEEEEDNE